MIGMRYKIGPVFRQQLLLLLVAVLCFSNQAYSQVEDRETVNFNVELRSYVNLSMPSNQMVRFEFVKIGNDSYQVVNANQELVFGVEASSNWQLDFRALEPEFSGRIDPENKVSLNNVGVTIQCVGNNTEQNQKIVNFAQQTPIALSHDKTALISAGSRGNIGDFEANSFLLLWEIGTSKGNMNPKSMLFQGIQEDVYSVNVDFTVSESYKPVRF